MPFIFTFVDVSDMILSFNRLQKYPWAVMFQSQRPCNIKCNTCTILSGKHLIICFKGVKNTSSHWLPKFRFGFNIKRFYETIWFDVIHNIIPYFLIELILKKVENYLQFHINMEHEHTLVILSNISSNYQSKFDTRNFVFQRI